jgi:hypothetical protein
MGRAREDQYVADFLRRQSDFCVIDKAADGPKLAEILEIEPMLGQADISQDPDYGLGRSRPDDISDDGLVFLGKGVGVGTGPILIPGPKQENGQPEGNPAVEPKHGCDTLSYHTPKKRIRLNGWRQEGEISHPFFDSFPGDGR